MKSTITAEIPAAFEAARLTQRSLESWLQTCEAFRAWERREILLREPDEKALAEYREALKWLLRSARLHQVLVKDPDFPYRHLVPQIDGVLIHLEESWNALNNPLSEEQAERLIAQYFPHEPQP